MTELGLRTLEELTVEKARKAGILVITLDTPLDPVTAADANFGTDNFKAGLLIGRWAKATLGDKAASAKIATLDLAPACSCTRPRPSGRK